MIALAPIRILTNGAGIAGTTLATLLRSSRPYAITSVKRASALRTGGQQIDLRAQGISVAHRMSLDLHLLDAVRASRVRETGITLIDRAGRTRAVLCVNDPGRGAQALSSDFEMIRGDLVAVLYRASIRAAAASRQKLNQLPLGVDAMLKYEFGKHATTITQQDGSGEVRVTFSDGSVGAYDLVVGTDGQTCRTRRLAFGEEAGQNAFRSLGVFDASSPSRWT